MHGGGIKRIAAVCFRQVIEVDDIKLGFNRVLCLVFLEGVICKFGLVVKLEIEQQATSSITHVDEANQQVQKTSQLIKTKTKAHPDTHSVRAMKPEEKIMRTMKSNNGYLQCK